MLMMMEMLLQGYFEHGKRDGHGTMRMANGDLWVGEYKANLRHGMGVYKQALTGVKEASRWHRDRRRRACAGSERVGPRASSTGAASSPSPSRRPR